MRKLTFLYTLFKACQTMLKLRHQQTSDRLLNALNDRDYIQIRSILSHHYSNKIAPSVLRILAYHDSIDQRGIKFHTQSTERSYSR